MIGTLGHPFDVEKMAQGEIIGQSVTNGLGIWLRPKRKTKERAKTSRAGVETCEFICGMGMKK